MWHSHSQCSHQESSDPSDSSQPGSSASCRVNWMPPVRTHSLTRSHVWCFPACCLPRFPWLAALIVLLIAIALTQRLQTLLARGVVRFVPRRPRQGVCCHSAPLPCFSLAGTAPCYAQHGQCMANHAAEECRITSSSAAISCMPRPMRHSQLKHSSCSHSATPSHKHAPRPDASDCSK